MKVVINGQPKDTNAKHIAEIVELHCKDTKHIIVEVNGAIVVIDAWKSTFLKDGDIIELVSFVGGG